jgi:hypothetical protein
MIEQEVIPKIIPIIIILFNVISVYLIYRRKLQTLSTKKPTALSPHPQRYWLLLELQNPLFRLWENALFAMVIPLFV